MPISRDGEHSRLRWRRPSQCSPASHEVVRKYSACRWNKLIGHYGQHQPGRPIYLPWKRAAPGYPAGPSVLLFIHDQVATTADSAPRLSASFFGGEETNYRSLYE
jgi:hypothetical protein